MKKRMDFNGDIITINSGNDHSITFGRNINTGELILRTQLIRDNNFFNRLSKGLKYIFGIEGKSPDYADFILSKGHSRWLLEIVTKLNSDSNLIRHAVREFELGGWTTPKGGVNIDTEMGIHMSTQTLELLAVLSTHGHSGGSIGTALTIFDKLARFKIISKLTLKNDEFDTKNNPTLWQNIRASNVFKDYKGYKDINAFSKEVKSSKFFNSPKIVKTNGGCWSGTVFESKNGIATGRGFVQVYLKEEAIKKGWMPRVTIALPVTQVEVKVDDYLMFVAYNATALKELDKIYDIDWFEVPDLANKEIIHLTENYGY